MNRLLLAFILLTGFSVFGQDTTEVYVINNTNRLIRIAEGNQNNYVIEYRNLKKLNQTVSISLGKKDAVYKFFDTCEKVLNTDTRIIGENYNVSRNKIDKNTVKVDNKVEGAYFLVKRETLENMRSALDKQP